MRFLAFLGLLGLVCGTVAINIKGSSPQLIKEWFDDQTNHKQARAEDVYVTLTNGTLKGTTYKAVGGDTIYAYLGIPYAAPPTGNLRFAPPQPFDEQWGIGEENARPAFMHPNACPQTLTNTTPAAEDCLFVSVYTKRRPEETTEEPLPVMYWIHGGGFLLGQTSYYTASKLLQQDVVLVTVQYRLGPLGFLSMQDEILPGNYGMKDMVQGLKWVQENIHHFGGNKDQVTVFGESAGAAAATFMLISPLARGLFHGAAAMSGTAIAEWSMDREPQTMVMKLAAELECPTDQGTQAIVDCLRGIDWQKISSSHFSLMLNGQVSQLKANLAGTSPVVEPDHPGAFISKEPLALLEEGDVAPVPVLMGANQHEGSFLLAVAYLLRIGNDGILDDEVYVHDKLIGDLLATWGVDESVNGASVSQVLAAGFIPNDNPRTNFTTFTYELIDMFSALFMKAPILRTAEILSRNPNVPGVYFYSFEYASQSSLWNFLALVELILPSLPELPIDIAIPPFDGGITHADDIIYMFSLPLIPSQADMAMSKVYCEVFTNFARDGEPAKTATDIYPAWPKFLVKDPNYMQLKKVPEVKQHYPASWRQGLTFPEK